MSISSYARAIVLSPYLTSHLLGHADLRTPDAKLAEAIGLAQAIHLDVLHHETIRLSKITPSTYFGRGTVDRMKVLIDDFGNQKMQCAEPHSSTKIELVIVDASLSPVQQRNLERAWGAKVIDRTALILEIFGERARTHEGRLQVELAALSYQRSRLVRSWTHLERQRGGFGFLGGPGESQLEVDRRLIDDRIDRIKRDLSRVERTRHLHRKARKKVPFPIVALVGYTNAGKSTLFNQMTQSSVFAKDLLFATLDPTMRKCSLPSGKMIILSDTVGFITDLPTMLIAAFRSTLEEVLEADLILHVRDISHLETDLQKTEVDSILIELGINQNRTPVLEVYNKIDLCPFPNDIHLSNHAQQRHPVAISALTGQGIPVLMQRIESLLTANWPVLEVHLHHTQGQLMSWIYDHGEILSRADHEEGVDLRIRLDPVNFERFQSMREQKISKKNQKPMKYKVF